MRPTFKLPRWAVFVLIFGAYLTIRGYHSRDGDQAYRLPILLHQQDSAVFADDPFVRAFDTFNPHRGYLALLDITSRPLGLSVALFGLFAGTFAAVCYGVDRLARSLWPQAGNAAGFLAVGLILLSKAGNVGTNHLFESMLLDRLIGFSLGWVALAFAVEGRTLVPGSLIGAVTLIHPSVGLQLGAMLAGSWCVWRILARWTGISTRTCVTGLIALALAMLPGVMLTLGQGSKLFEGMDPAEYRLLGVQLQMAQHMVPSMWRQTQWLAWACYIGLGLIGVVAMFANDSAVPRDDQTQFRRARFASTFVLLLAGLGVAYLAVEVAQNLQITVLQPFRMATIARGLALMAISGRLAQLVQRSEPLAWVRALVLAAGLAGDRAMIVATLFEFATIACSRWKISIFVPLGILAIGTFDLARHDTESGHVGMLIATVIGFLVLYASRLELRVGWNRRRVTLAAVVCWAVPFAAFAAPIVFGSESRIAAELAARCRFAAVPTDDIERLAVWSRAHTEPNARFITAPGPKTFRLWSERAVAFNRAASPYHAAGLRDWSDRFRAHVGFEGSTESFVNGYLSDRHAFESRFARLNADELATLAKGQGASYVLAAKGIECGGQLKVVASEGRYSIYRLESRSADVAMKAKAAAK